MEKQVTKEGEKEHELFEKFMCYCKNGVGDLEKSIADAEEKLGSLPKQIEAAESEVKQLGADIKQAKEDRGAAKKATVAIEKGMAGSFLQTSAAQVLRNLVTS